MKVGDLVKFNSDQRWAEGLNIVGIVIDVGVFAGNKDVKVLWNCQRDAWANNTYKSQHLEVVSERR